MIFLESVRSLFDREQSFSSHQVFFTWSTVSVYEVVLGVESLRGSGGRRMVLVHGIKHYGSAGTRYVFVVWGRG